jgi:hypothetical protein
VGALFTAGCGSSGNASGATTGVAASALRGTYKTTIETTALGGELSGNWKVRFQPGTYTLNFTGKTDKNVIISGPYEISGKRITFRQREAACSSKSRNGCRLINCRGAGTYTFELIRLKLSFDTIRGSKPDCELRRVLLAGNFGKVR